jgi:retron-type reverse transcriptase
MENWISIREKIEKGAYFPDPLRRVEIPKPNGGVWKLKQEGVT